MTDLFSHRTVGDLSIYVSNKIHSSETKLIENYPPSSEEMGISSEESSEEILRLMRKNPKITAKKIAERLNITSRAVEKQVFILKQNGRLERVGSTKCGSWHVIEK